MPCREISPEILRTNRTLEDVYTSLGVLKPAGNASTPIAPPRTFLPEGMAMSTFPYLTGTDGRNFNLAPLFANNREPYNCVLTTVDYNETRARELADESKDMNDAEFQTFVSGLPAAEATSFNIYRTLAVLEFMRADAPQGGNTDGNRDVIAATEIENWAWRRSNHNRTQFAQMGGDAISRLHAFLGLASFLTSETSAAPDVVTPDAANPATDAVVVSATDVRNDRVVDHGDAGVHTDASAPVAGVETPVATTPPPETSSPWGPSLLAGLIGGLIGAGAMAFMRRPAESAPKPESKPSSPETPSGAVPIRTTPPPLPPSGGDFANVLEALSIDAEEKPLETSNAFREIITLPVNDAEIAAQFEAIDSNLAEYYRSQISNSASPLSTMGELLARLSITNPEALEKAQSAMATSGHPLTDHPERFIFELVANAAQWKPGDTVNRSSLVGNFEANLRNATRSGARPEGAEPATRRHESDLEVEGRRPELDPRVK